MENSERELRLIYITIYVSTFRKKQRKPDISVPDVMKHNKLHCNNCIKCNNTTMM